MTGACLLRVREASKSSLKVGTCKGEAKSTPKAAASRRTPKVRSRGRSESWPVRSPLFSADLTLWTREPANKSLTNRSAIADANRKFRAARRDIVASARPIKIGSYQRAQW
jgi:hypothetical protein